jgi:hypothetical protein
VGDPNNRNKGSNNFVNNATESNSAETVANFPPPRLTINLKECKYDIFRKIGIEDLNYRVILSGEVV